MAGVYFKILGKGKQPASLTPVVTELRIHGTNEAISIPCITSTKVGEIREMLAAKLGISDTGKLNFVEKRGGGYFRQQDPWEEVGRSVTITGIKSFAREKKEYSHPFVIIGAGHVGLRHALWLIKHKHNNFVLFDRRAEVGGTSWLAQANPTSKLQTELGTYHLEYDELNSVPKDLYPWPTAKTIVADFKRVAEEYGIMPYCRMSTNVKMIAQYELKNYGGAPQVDYQLVVEPVDRGYSDHLPPKIVGTESDIMGSCVFMYPGNLTMPRKVTYKGEELFDGMIGYGHQEGVDYEKVKGKTCVILGHGAFAVENVRTCCEMDATKIFLVCRRKNLACPRVCSWFVNQTLRWSSGSLFMKTLMPMYNLIDVDPWDMHSVMCNEKRTNVTITQKARFGIGDVYFLALYMGKCELIVDSVKRLTKGTVQLESGMKLKADCILKLLGFTGEWDIDRLMKVKEMHGFWVNGDYRRYVAAEPIGVNANNFGGTSLSPGAISWVSQATHMMWYPRDAVALMESGMLPTHKAEPDEDRPAYVLDARQGTAVGMVVGQYCPQIAEYGWITRFLKSEKQRHCHPMKTYLAQCKDEWDEYGKRWIALDPKLEDPPPYPFTEAIIQGYLDEVEKADREAGVFN